MAVRPVVAGVDGSPTSVVALAHAAWQADRRKLPLEVVACHGPTASAQAEAEALVAGLTDEVRAAWPRVEVTGRAIAGREGATLVRLSAEATLMVIGSRGRGGFTGLLLGSVGTQLAAHSDVPVILVRPPDEDPYAAAQISAAEFGAAPPPRPVVVGVEDFATSEAMIEFAADEAAARAAPLVMLHAWWTLPISPLGPKPVHQHGATVPEVDLDAAEEEVRRMLAEAVAGQRARYPEVAIELRPVHTLNAAAALLDAGAEAGLLVVSRHRSNRLSRRLFSVGATVVRHAPGPTAGIPQMSPTHTA